MSNKRQNEELDYLNAFALLTQTGLTLAIPIIIGIVAGRWIDRSMDSGHLFLFVFLAIGLVVGFYGAYREFKRVNPMTLRRKKK